MAKVSWADRIPGVLAELHESDLPTISRAHVQRLLGLRPRRAQLVLQQAGGTCGEKGKSLIIPTRDFVLFLECIAPQAAAQEQWRRQRLAQKLSEARQQWIDRGGPPRIVRVETWKVDHVRKGGVAALPPGVTVRRPIDTEKGRIEIEFSDPREALEKLALLSTALDKDLEWFWPSSQPFGEPHAGKQTESQSSL